jgi:hypothetical protein
MEFSSRNLKILASSHAQRRFQSAQLYQGLINTLFNGFFLHKENFMRIILLSLLISFQALAGLPPTTSKVSGDSTDLTTYKYQFPNFTGTHTGTTVSLGVNAIAGGGTNNGSLAVTNGGVVYTDGTKLMNSGAGTANQYLASIGAGAPAWTSFVAPTIQKFTSTGTTTGYNFTITAGNATVGATYTNNGQTFTVLSTIAAATTLYTTATGAPEASGTLTKATGTGDATLTFSAATATATYTLPTSPRNPVYIRVRMVGGGGGGAGSADATNDGGNGGDGAASRFGAALIIANGGLGGISAASSGIGGTGGSASLGTAVGTSLTGGKGQGFSGGATSQRQAGGGGAPSPFGGAGGGGAAATAGQNASANTGSGGAGGGAPVAGFNGPGGGAGGFADALITSPSATYQYVVGANGTAGTAGTSGFVGGTGAAGYIEVTEYYQ